MMCSVQLAGGASAVRPKRLGDASRRLVNYWSRRQPLVRAFVMVPLSLSVSLGTATAQLGDPRPPEVRRVCQPAFWGGVLAGRTRVDALKRLFGPTATGLSHGEGVLTYSDPASTRRVDIRFLDNVVISLDVWEVASAPRLGSATPRPAKTSWINLAEGVGTWAAINVGTSRANVLDLLGRPARSVETNEGLTSWTYESVCACELPAGFTLRFRGDRLVSFGIWQETG